MSPPDKVERHHKRPHNSKCDFLKLGVVPGLNPFLIGNGNTNQVDQDNQIPIPCHSSNLFKFGYFSINSREREKLSLLLIRLTDVFKFRLEYSSAVINQLYIPVGQLYPRQCILVKTLPFSSEVLPELCVDALVDYGP